MNLYIKLLKKSLLFLMLLFLYGCESKTPQPITVNILHMNDIHSHLESESLDLDFNGSIFRFEAGGYPLIGDTIKHLKSTQEHTLLLYAGDAVQGTLYYTLFHGEADAKMMNLVEWDAFSLGNHEFDEGDKQLTTFINTLSIPILSSNITAPQSNPLYKLWDSYIIRQFDGEQVGIIGVNTVKATRDSSSPGADIEFFDPFHTVQEQVELLELQGINKIIVVSHLGYEVDKNLAESVEGVDVIVGGHSHTVLGEFDTFGLSTQGLYPTLKESQRDEKVCIVQAGSYAKMVGNLEVNFDKEGKVVSCAGTPVIALSQNVTYKDAKGIFTELNSSLQTFVQKEIESSPLLYSAKPDSALQLELQQYKEQVAAKKFEIIGYAQEQINHVRIPSHAYGSISADANPLGSDIAPVVAKAFYERVKTSEIVILNAGGVRTSIKKGKISTDTLYSLLPFSNTLMTFTMTGLQIHQLLEEAIEHVGADYSGSGSFPYAYGMRYDVNMSASEGNRVSNLDILQADDKGYLKLDEKRNYSVTTIEYLASGKDGYTTFKTLKGIDSYFEYADSFVVYVDGLQKSNKMLSKVPAKDHCIKKFTP